MTNLRGRAGAGVAPLPFSPIPVPGENLHGYLRRLAAANGHVNMSTFLGACGLLTGFGPLTDDPPWERLRALTELLPGAFATMRWRAVQSPAGNRVSFLRGHVAPAHVHPRSMRFCPECLRRDGIRRDLWSVGKVVACPVHAVSLVDACPACGCRFDPEAVGSPDSCPCGFRLADIVSTAAPAIAVVVSRNLARMFGQRLAAGIPGRSTPVELPHPFAGIGAFDYLAYLDVLGTAAATPAADDPPGSTAANYTRGRRAEQPSIAATNAVLKAAHTLMADWPAGFDALLGRLDGRGQPPLMDPTPYQAFSSAIGRSLRHPQRGEDGLPLPLIHEAFDAYWRRGHGKRRRRNATVGSAAARAIRPLFTAAELSRAVGDRVATQFHGRVVRRVLSTLTDGERAIEPVALASLVRARCIALHAAAATALSPNAAKRALEGTNDHLALAGWDHPGLLPPDADLRDLRMVGEAYRKEAVAGMLARLRDATARVDDPGRMVPLVSVAMRYAVRRPPPTKTEVLLRLLAGTLSAAKLVDDPTLGDVLVDPDDLNAGVAARRASSSSDALISATEIDALMRERHGDAAGVDANLLHRLVRAGLVRSEVRTLSAGSAGRPVTALFCDVEEVVGIIGRRSAGTLAPEEAAAIGIGIDVGPLLRGLRAAGLSQAALAGELTARGISTVRGAAWTGAAVFKALAKPPGEPIPAIATPSS